MKRTTLTSLLFFSSSWSVATDPPYTVVEDPDGVTIETPELRAVIRRTGYVSGVAGRTFLDRKTGFRDAGFGLDIVDWIMEPGKDDGHRDKLPDHMVYQYDNSYHGKRPKRSIEGPQICTKARRIDVSVIRGGEFVAVKNTYRYRLAAPGRKPGSLWTQLLVFPRGKRYFLSADRIDSVNRSDAMFLRIDMPGHIRHDRGSTFSEIYLSYLKSTNTPGLSDSETGTIPSSVFFRDFPPDEKLNYRRDRLGGRLPERFIRAYRLRDPQAGRKGPWLAGMTLDPSVVHEAWCHQRGYVCMIQEFGGRPVKAGEAFSAAFVVGFFDSIDEMHAVYDRYRGRRGLVADEQGWKLVE